MSGCYLKWLLITIKKNIRSLTFWMMVLIFGIVCALTSFIGRKQTEETEILLYSEGSVKGDEIIGELEESNTDGFAFTRVSDREDMETCINRGEAPCGFVFTKDFDEAADKNDPDGEIILYMASDSLDGYVAKEIIYPYVLKSEAGGMLNDYLHKTGDDTAAARYVTEEYSKILQSGNLDIYETVTVDTQEKKNNVNSSGMKNMFMVLAAAIFVLLWAVGEYHADRQFMLAFGMKKRILLCVENSAVTLGMIMIIIYLAENVRR